MLFFLSAGIKKMIGKRNSRIVAQDIPAQQEGAAARTNDQKQAIEQLK
jgi:hypothetical protein